MSMRRLLAVDDQADAVVFVERDGGGEEEEELRPPVERPALGRLIGGGRGLLAARCYGNGGLWDSLLKEQIAEVARPLEGELLVCRSVAGGVGVTDENEAEVGVGLEPIDGPPDLNQLRIRYRRYGVWVVPIERPEGAAAQAEREPKPTSKLGLLDARHPTMAACITND